MRNTPLGTGLSCRAALPFVLKVSTTQSDSSYRLDVNGNVRANQVIVNTSGADFVFEPGYHLPNLKELGQYICREHHLPGIVLAAQMQTQGVDFSKCQKVRIQ